MTEYQIIEQWMFRVNSCAKSEDLDALQRDLVSRISARSQEFKAADAQLRGGTKAFHSWREAKSARALAQQHLQLLTRLLKALHRWKRQRVAGQPGAGDQFVLLIASHRLHVAVAALKAPQTIEEEYKDTHKVTAITREQSALAYELLTQHKELLCFEDVSSLTRMPTAMDRIVEQRVAAAKARDAQLRSILVKVQDAGILTDEELAFLKKLR